MTDVVKVILAESGPIGFYRGLLPQLVNAMLKEAVLNAVRLEITAIVSKLFQMLRRLVTRERAAVHAHGCKHACMGVCMDTHAHGWPGVPACACAPEAVRCECEREHGQEVRGEGRWRGGAPTASLLQPVHSLSTP